MRLKFFSVASLIVVSLATAALADDVVTRERLHPSADNEVLAEIELITLADGTQRVRIGRTADAGPSVIYKLDPTTGTYTARRAEEKRTTTRIRTQAMPIYGQEQNRRWDVRYLVEAYDARGHKVTRTTLNLDYLECGFKNLSTPSNVRVIDGSLYGECQTLSPGVITLGSWSNVSCTDTDPSYNWYTVGPGYGYGPTASVSGTYHYNEAGPTDIPQPPGPDEVMTVSPHVRIGHAGRSLYWFDAYYPPGGSFHDQINAYIAAINVSCN